MAHSHSNTHHHPSGENYRRAFAWGIGLNVAFVAVEIFYGLAANSSALLADAGHNASDVLSLVFAWAATWMATLRPKGKYTYGLRKTTILVSMLNALLLFGAAGVIAWDAIGKFKNPEPVAGPQVMLVAGIGVVINTLTALLFLRGQKHDLNIKGAFLHMTADAGVSLGVLGAGFLITRTSLHWIDPLTSLVIIAVIVWGTWGLFSDSVSLALDAVPKHIQVDEVRNFLVSLNGVSDLHDLHIWAMSTTRVALTVHLVVPSGYDDNFIAHIQEELQKHFGISHTTIQIEKRPLHPDCNQDC